MAQYASEVSAVETEWNAEYSEQCDLSSVTVVLADTHTLADLCNETPTLLGCHSKVPRPDRHVVVISDKHEDEARNTVTHELLHICAATSGAFPDDQPAHDDPALWANGGILDRVNTELGLPHD